MSNINVNNITPLVGTSGTVNVSGSLLVSGSITANGNIVLGNSTADSVSLGAEVSSSIIPDATATYNLGSDAKKWNEVVAVSGSFLHISGATNFTNNVTVTGSMTVSGSSTFTNFGNFRNRFPQDDRHFEVTTDPTVAGGHREGLATPNTGSAPHLHFMLTGSGYAGVGLLNPSHTLHVSTSDGSFSKVALYVDGKSYFGSTISSSLTPHADKTYNLGTAALQWENLHVSTASLAYLHAKTGTVINVSGSLLPTTTNAFSLGNATHQWKSGSFVHVSSSTISASGFIYAAGNLDIDGSTILGNQTANDTHTITGKSVAISGPITASTAITHISGANGNILGFKSGSFNGELSANNIKMDGTTMDIDATGIVSLTSTLNAANSILLHANGGTSETIKLHADQSTSVRSIGLISDAGGIELDMNASSKKIALLSTGAVDIDAAEGITIDSVGADMTLTVTAASAGQDLILRQNGSQDASVEIQSAGTGDDAVWIRSTNAAGSIYMQSANNIAVEAADDITLTTTSADGELVLSSSHTAGRAIHIEANTNAGSILDIDAGILDIDATGEADISGSAVNISGSTGIHMGSTSGGFDLDVATTFDLDASGEVDISGSAVNISGSTGIHMGSTSGGLDVDLATTLDIDATGEADISGSAVNISGSTGIHMGSTSGGINIDSADNITIDAADDIALTSTSADGLITLHSAHEAGQAILIDAKADGGSILDIDAGILDIDAVGEADISGSAVNISGSTGIHMGSTSGGLDVDAAGAITIDASGAASDIKITTAHTAGVAFHLDANANAASEVQIDAGILDIDVTGAATIDAASLVITGPVTAATGVQSTAIALTATDAGVAIPAGTAAALINADSDANHIVILPAPIVGNVINIIETGTTGYELRSSTPASIAINGGTASNGESAIAGAITYIKCVCVSSTSWICSQYDADGDESKVEAAA